MMEQKKLRTIDIKLLDEVFEMEGGYVLDFKNRTFSEFFIDELAINIDSPAYAVNGPSKAKRLRCYLKQASTSNVVKVLLSLWEYRETLRRRSGKKEEMQEAKTEFLQLIKKLGGKPPEEITINTTSKQNYPIVDEKTYKDLLRQLETNNPPTLLAFFVRLKFCYCGYIACYAPFATKLKTKKNSTQYGWVIYFQLP